MASLKIKLEAGEKVPEEVMELLSRFAGHRRYCDDCEHASKDDRIQPCATGRRIMEDLMAIKGVEYV